jgi:Mg/Co/Ni transporter MgtE
MKMFMQILWITSIASIIGFIPKIAEAFCPPALSLFLLLIFGAIILLKADKDKVSAVVLTILYILSVVATFVLSTIPFLW